jgi:hypothetical protein
MAQIQYDFKKRENNKTKRHPYSYLDKYKKVFIRWFWTECHICGYEFRKVFMWKFKEWTEILGDENYYTYDRIITKYICKDCKNEKEIKEYVLNKNRHSIQIKP